MDFKDPRWLVFLAGFIPGLALAYYGPPSLKTCLILAGVLLLGTLVYLALAVKYHNDDELNKPE